jgi:TP53 regulating kinase-like protein
MLIKRGAEAEIHLVEWMNRKVIQKRRVKKGYRVKEVDEKIRRRRTKKESLLLAEARKAGIPTPIVYDVDLKEAQITMQYLDYPRIKEVLEEIDREKMKEICQRIGELMAKMHAKGIVHGDVTTSNMIIGDKKIYFIDFGLGERDSSIEGRAVDLHVLMEALDASLHPECFEWVFHGYELEIGGEAEAIKKKIGEIIKRGRYL